ncbi:hypothetical protein ACFWP3_04720 [Streptomyces sp. NPDC058525]|uniref:hypothetical protein n=1 Tax=Streptomyces sp. NPDC058525 TaxID=3346538 RepID=UPI00364AF411
MLPRIIIVAVSFAILVIVNRFLISPYWGELVATAVIAGAMTYALGKVGTRENAEPGRN